MSEIDFNDEDAVLAEFAVRTKIHPLQGRLAALVAAARAAVQS